MADPSVLLLSLGSYFRTSQLILLSTRATLEYQMGEFGTGRIYVDRLLQTIEQRFGTGVGIVSQTSVGALSIAKIARISGSYELFDQSETMATRFLQSDTLSPLGAMLANHTLAITAIHKGDQKLAAEIYEKIRPHRGMLSFMGIWSNDRLLGLLAQAVGQFAISATHFDEAMEFCRKTEAKPELAWSLHDYADMLLERDEPGDRQKDTAMLDESLQISTDLSMRPLMERVLSKRDILKA
jgi:hypothetical protein